MREITMPDDVAFNSRHFNSRHTRRLDTPVAKIEVESLPGEGEKSKAHSVILDLAMRGKLTQEGFHTLAQALGYKGEMPQVVSGTDRTEAQVVPLGAHESIQEREKERASDEEPGTVAAIPHPKDHSEQPPKISSMSYPKRVVFDRFATPAPPIAAPEAFHTQEAEKVRVKIQNGRFPLGEPLLSYYAGVAPDVYEATLADARKITRDMGIEELQEKIKRGEIHRTVLTRLAADYNQMAVTGDSLTSEEMRNLDLAVAGAIATGIKEGAKDLAA